MSCLSPEDPKVSEIVGDHEDLELALFLSKMLVTGIMDFTSKKKRATTREEDEPEVEIVGTRIIKTGERGRSGRGRLNTGERDRGRAELRHKRDQVVDLVPSPPPTDRRRTAARAQCYKTYYGGDLHIFVKS